MDEIERKITSIDADNKYMIKTLDETKEALKSLGESVNQLNINMSGLKQNIESIPEIYATKVEVGVLRGIVDNLTCDTEILFRKSESINKKVEDNSSTIASFDDSKFINKWFIYFSMVASAISILIVYTNST